MVVLELVMMNLLLLLLLLVLHEHGRMDVVGQLKGKEREGVAFCGASRDEDEGLHRFKFSPPLWSVGVMLPWMRPIRPQLCSRPASLGALSSLPSLVPAWVVKVCVT